MAALASRSVRLSLADCQGGALPGVTIAAHAPGLILWDCAGGPDWSEGEPGRYQLDAVNSRDWADDGMIGEYDTLPDAMAAAPTLRPYGAPDAIF